MTMEKKSPYVGPSEGTHVMMRGGNVFVKTGEGGAFGRFAMGTQQVLKGVGIPIHRHVEMDETFYVAEGSGIFIIDEVRYPIEKGGSIFIPRLSWHGFENPDCELLLVWIMGPPGVEQFFPELGTPPGVPAVPRTKDQVNAITRNYGTEFR
jgi:mannose-6-phosphate isomerase-like protein (cupin superfamily)